MSDELTAEEVRSLLNLEPNATCGFVRGTYVSGPSIAAGGLPPPFANQRPMGSALYFPGNARRARAVAPDSE
jgi:hypothetical protein